MFTGIIQEVGTIKKISKQKEIVTLTLEAPLLAPTKKLGDSVALDGACLTVTKQDSKTLTFEAVPETIQRTIIQNYQQGSKVNLESSLKIGDSLDGHFVSGHIDGIGTIKEIAAAETAKTMTISVPETLLQYFALKGSVAINGVSLTISKLEQGSIEVALIPYTLEHTNLGLLQKNGTVNIEVDLISRYVEALLAHKAKETTYQFLQERGFI